MSDLKRRVVADLFATGRAMRPFLAYLLVSLCIMSSARIALMIAHADRVSAADGWSFILLQGMRFDLVLQGLLLAIPLSLTPLLCVAGPVRRVWERLLPALLTVLTVFIVFMELATPSFILEYDLRPNILFVQYLEYPREVLSMLWTGYRLPIFIGLIVLPIVGWSVLRLYRRQAAALPRTGLVSSLLAVPVLLFVCAVAWRSSFDHRPVNPSDVAFSTDPLVNMLPLSSAYSMLYGAYEMRHENAGIQYGEIEPQRVLENIRRMTGLPPEAFTSDELPTLHRQQSALPKKKNLVILLHESLGAGFVGALDGLPLTPNLDALSEQGIWFTNFYATGTRSIRGIEAVTTGFLPTTTESVVKLGGAQRGFFTIAQLLQREGYDTSFIYGGSAQFDNMRRFFLGNGFSKVIDEQDYAEPVFAGSWGVSDEDLVNKADEYFDQLPDDQPFFSLVFTTSNHVPFEYPAGRITPYNEPAYTRENAIKYADYATGEFIKAARNSKYWDNTIFLIVADHDSRVKGAELVPIRHFHIPALILGKDIAPATVDRLASQVDLIPTLIPLLGLDVVHPATGVDLLDAKLDVPPHAVMQYGDNIAYRENDDVLVFQPQRPPLQFEYRDQALQPVETVNPSLLEMALSHTEWPRLAYRNKWYRLPDPVKAKE